MSYVEHGPRIFLAGRPNTDTTLVYGDYLLPRKRSEGRLKAYDSCSDIRAWSPNMLENSRYFRELTEHATTLGKIIPYNVVLENIINLSSQAQNELYILRKELKKYKMLELTPEQQKYLLNLDESITEVNEPPQNKKNTERDDTIDLFSKKDIINLEKSVSATHFDSCLYIPVYPEKEFNYFQSLFHNKNSLPKINNLENKFFRIMPKIDNSRTFNQKSVDSEYDKTLKTQSACAEYVDICLQTLWSTEEIGVQTDILTNRTALNEKPVTIQSNTSIHNSVGDSNSEIDKEEKCSKINGFGKGSSSSESCCTESEFDSVGITGTEYESDTSERCHKTIIIKKDCEIIALKNELGAKEAELEELRETNRNINILCRRKEENLNSLEQRFKIIKDQFIKLNNQRNYELEDLKKKLLSYKCMIEQLKEDLNENRQTSYSQSQEIEKLRLRAEETTTLILERDSLAEKVKEMGRLSKEAEKCDDALKQLKDALREKDELQKQNKEQVCILADQEDEIKRLFMLLRHNSATYSNRQITMKNLLDNLRTEIQEKDNKIFNYEKQLLCMEQEISDFSIKFSDECDVVHDKICNCSQHSHNIKAKHTLCTMNRLMIELQKYKTERRILLQQIEHFKHYTQNVKNLHIMNMPEAECYKDYLLEDTNKSLVLEPIGSDDCLDKENSDLDMWDIAKESFEYNTSNLETRISIQSNKSDNNSAETTVMKELSQSSIKRQFIKKELQLCIETDQILDANKDMDDIKLLYSSEETEAHKLEKILSSLKDLDTKKCLKILHQLQKIMCYDNQVDEVLTIHMQCSIERMYEISTALQGAGDNHIKIIEEVVRQQKLIQNKDFEISQLKKQVQRGEGDNINQANLNFDSTKKDLEMLHNQLDYKEVLVNELQKSLKEYELKLCACTEDCIILRKEKESFISELEVKTEENVELFQQLQNFKEVEQILTNTEKDAQELKTKLDSLQKENNKLRQKFVQINEIITKKDEDIRDLKNTIEKNKSVLEMKYNEYVNIVEAKDKLKNKNLFLENKLKDTTTKISQLTEQISTINKKNDEIVMLMNFQENLSHLKEDKSKLNIKSIKQKLQLLNYQNSNKRSKEQLDSLLIKNEILKQEIEVLKAKYVQQSASFVEDATIDNDVKEDLSILTNKIYNKIINLKEQVMILDSNIENRIETTTDTNPFARKDNNSRINASIVGKPHDEQCVSECSKHPQEKHDMLTDEIDNLPVKVKFNQEDTNDNRYKSFYLENNIIGKSIDLDKLTQEINCKNSTIESLTKTIKCLSEEKDNFYTKLMQCKENYQSNLTILKKKYDSGINAVHKKHVENIKYLRVFFEETKGEQDSFNYENWLKSLSIKELTEIQNRIYLLISNLGMNHENNIQKYDPLIFENRELHDNIEDIDELRKRQKDINKKDRLKAELQYEPLKLQKEKILNSEQYYGSNIENDNILMQRQFLEIKNYTNIENDNQIFHTYEIGKVGPFESLCDPLDYKQTQNLSEQEKRIQNTILKPISETLEMDTFDLQRKNFINQCSMFHRTDIC